MRPGAPPPRNAARPADDRACEEAARANDEETVPFRPSFANRSLLTARHRPQLIGADGACLVCALQDALRLALGFHIGRRDGAA